MKEGNLKMANSPEFFHNDSGPESHAGNGREGLIKVTTKDALGKATVYVRPGENGGPGMIVEVERDDQKGNKS